MEAKKLMIGDWVYIFDPDYKEEKEAYKVSEIREDGIRTYMFNDTYEEGWFEPIPLTEEILKANGFEKVHHEGTGGTEEYDDYIINGFLCRHMTEDWKDLHFCLPNTPIRFNYVHELQRVLRCCGLWDLANNFKLE